MTAWIIVGAVIAAFLYLTVRGFLWYWHTESRQYLDTPDQEMTERLWQEFETTKRGAS